ncbi:hypothetical protein GCM10012285_07050 [Streptomyces kronopolitis]|uniref:Uncharacterized protein n=1 Tax=Streptomyces kronopolitis TaxID=1612435 RepID=A0ABQ2J273_9ACTN|nr:hypothetical protein GCM10012285_07050 [Streptomyces kronopolitis]
MHAENSFDGWISWIPARLPPASVVTFSANDMMGASTVRRPADGKRMISGQIYAVPYWRDMAQNHLLGDQVPAAGGHFRAAREREGRLTAWVPVGRIATIRRKAWDPAADHSAAAVGTGGE